MTPKQKAIEEYRPTEEEFQQDVADEVKFQEGEPDPSPWRIIMIGMVMAMRTGVSDVELRARMEEMVADARVIKSLMIGNYL